MKYVIQNKYWNIVEDYNIDKLLYLLIDRPNEITNWNDFIWENNKNNGHRDYDLPAFICNNRYVSWDVNNRRHRENNKPAFISKIGFKRHYLNGNFIREE